MKKRILATLTTATLTLTLAFTPITVSYKDAGGVTHTVEKNSEIILEDVAGIITEDTTHVDGLDDAILIVSIEQDGKYDELQEYMVGLINEKRAEAGVEPVVLDDDLSSSARYRSAHMFTKNYFSHYYNKVAQPSPVHQAICDGINYTWIGENIFRTRASFDLTTRYTEEELMERAINGFCNSPSHYKIMIKEKATRVGIGIYFNENKSHMYITQLYSN